MGMKVISAVFMLILMSLFIINGQKTVSVINALGGNVNSFTKAIVSGK